MADLKREYTQHIQDTAPDMDKLWNRISDEIDKRESENNTDTQAEENRRQIKRSGGYMKIAAAAAAFVVIFAGVNIINESKKAKTARDNIPLSRPERQEEKSADDGAAENDAIAEAHSDDTAAPGELAEAATEEVDGNLGYYNNGSTVKYEELSFSPTDTVAYMAGYVAQGDEYFVEKNVLEETEFFADVTVSSAEIPDTGSAEYILTVNAMYDRNGEVTASDIELTSSTPYILQAGREYLLPLKKISGGQYAIVFENAPQIELTLDGGAVYQNGWSALDNDSVALEKDSLNVNDFYFDRMKYTPYLDMDQLITEWKMA
ncbi:hypothetical protein [Ruminococcus sp.]|uniref:hypothetical protein n=1 Tax=Ruminococcus sp. TaxID=41978 RepID=UPI0025FBD04F|nr:hypothetical protein [Ruminococcus sp.]MBQ8967979.1 hypothetical protein [Ruminococcus sp.]